jgi:hypothetical protein
MLAWLEDAGRVVFGQSRLRILAEFSGYISAECLNPSAKSLMRVQMGLNSFLRLGWISAYFADVSQIAASFDAQLNFQ